MQIYLVGGAVRDQLLGRAVHEKDWVVVGSTVDEMLQLGFKQVGKDFPVFLHPKTHEEYALARLERKIDKGYRGFQFDASTTVSLEEDLQRRDLTINAIALSADQQLIDPFHGQQDLKEKVLRHVSFAFVEDPVRILRVGRFLARFASLGFCVAPDTMQLMQNMVAAGEVDALVSERVWKELERALGEPHPEKFFLVLSECGALEKLFPSLKPCDFSALQQVVQQTMDKECRFAGLLSSLSEVTLKALCVQYRIPNNYKDLALLVVKYHSAFAKLDKMDDSVLQILVGVDAFRREQRFLQFCTVCQTLMAGEQGRLIMQAYAAAQTINAPQIAEGGGNVAERIYAARLAAIKGSSKQ
jgi:tRNA nucleotidyltransferase (CCA-adding enzyme)